MDLASSKSGTLFSKEKFCNEMMIVGSKICSVSPKIRSALLVSGISYKDFRLSDSFLFAPIIFFNWAQNFFFSMAENFSELKRIEKRADELNTTEMVMYLFVNSSGSTT